MKDATVDQTAQGVEVARALGYGVTGNFVIDPAWTRSRTSSGCGRSSSGTSCSRPASRSSRRCRAPRTSRRCARGSRARPWAQFDMHHLLWEPALGPERFFELYCETWRRSVLNLRGRKSVWQWMREVDPRNAAVPAAALRRTQRMMEPAALPRGIRSSAARPPIELRARAVGDVRQATSRRRTSPDRSARSA